MILPRRPSGVVLDADGTLWDTNTAMLAAGEAGARAVWPGLGRREAALASARFRGDPQGMFRRFVAGGSTFEEMREARLRDVAGALDLPWRPDARVVFGAAYLPVFEASLVAYPDAGPFLAWCAEQELPVRVLTNAGTRETLTKACLTDLVSLDGAVCSRECVGAGKPDPRSFRHVCAELGLDPHDVLYVGDEWTADALGAADAGLESVWLVRGHDDPAGEVVATAERRAAALARGIPVVASLAEVPALLGPR